MKNKKEISDKKQDKNSLTELEDFIKQKNEENEVLKILIDKINSDKKVQKDH